MIAAVAAFLGGMLFALGIVAGTVVWLSRGLDGPLPDDCEHCQGTGYRTTPREP